MSMYLNECYRMRALDFQRREKTFQVKAVWEAVGSELKLE